MAIYIGKRVTERVPFLAHSPYVFGIHLHYGDIVVSNVSHSNAVPLYYCYVYVLYACVFVRDKERGAREGDCADWGCTHWPRVHTGVDTAQRQ